MRTQNIKLSCMNGYTEPCENSLDEDPWQDGYISRSSCTSRDIIPHKRSSEWRNSAITAILECLDIDPAETKALRRRSKALFKRFKSSAGKMTRSDATLFRLVALTLTIKAHEDDAVWNIDCLEDCGLPIGKMSVYNAAEKLFLSSEAINYNLHFLEQSKPTP